MHDHVAVDPRRCPLAWRDLHRSLDVGAEVGIAVSADPDRWPRRRLHHVVTGAGFAVLDERSNDDRVTLTLRREHTLADTVGPGMRLLLVGLNPSPYAAEVGVGFARPGNRAWPALAAAGLAEVDRDPLHLLRHAGIGMTDLVKRTTATAGELRAEEFRDGLERLEILCDWLQPTAVCVLGITGWRAATGARSARLGPQAATLGRCPVHVMPNPSGLNAHTDIDDLVRHLRAAMELR